MKEKSCNNYAKAKSLLIVGKNGSLGKAFVEACNRRLIAFHAHSHADLDITREKDIEKVIAATQPWAIINAAGYVDIEKAEQEPDACYKLNATGAALLADQCKKNGIRLVTFSSDMVFGGEKNTPYDEADLMYPLNVYGSSKFQAETMVREICSESLVIRTSAFFGPWDRYNFVYKVIDAVRNNKQLDVAHNITVSPTYIPDLADAALDLLSAEKTGLWHLTNEQAMSWADFAVEIADRTKYPKKMLLAKSQEEMGWLAKRPLYSALSSAKGIAMPSLSNALNRYFQQVHI